jgi:tRNA-dihydrouridine synthase A
LPLVDEKARAWRFSVAPMMDWTDRHCRVFHRTLSRRARLYTEMVTTGAVLHGPRDRLLGFDPVEHPIAAQLGGSVPRDVAEAAAICVDFGYDEVNLNCGCPSDRVQNGAFGACLMRTPELVGDCVTAMRAAVDVPVTVKCRIGVDHQDPSEALWSMARLVQEAGADVLIVHARKAWLKGLSPRENRDVPPLDYELVRRLKAEFPQLTVAINGGIGSLSDALAHLTAVDGVMMGRAAYQTPEILLGVDSDLFGEPAPAGDGFAALDVYEPYIAAGLARGVRLHDMTRCLLGLFAGLPGARAWRRHLATEGQRQGAGLEVLRAARALVRRVKPAQAA